MPWYEDDGKLHDTVVLHLAQHLKKKHPENDIRPNVIWRKTREGPPLDADKSVYPDVVDYTAKLAYEVHWKGSRKEATFGSLPEGWAGVNVFIDDAANPYSIVVRMPGYQITVLDTEF